MCGFGNNDHKDKNDSFGDEFNIRACMVSEELVHHLSQNSSESKSQKTLYLEKNLDHLKKLYKMTKSFDRKTTYAYQILSSMRQKKNCIFFEQCTPKYCTT